MKVIYLRFGELFLKGNNQKYFTKVLVSNIKKALYGIDYILQKSQMRYIIRTNEENLQIIIEKLKFVFGLYSFSIASEVRATRFEIENYVKSIIIKEGTFRVSVKRADKSFPVISVEYEKLLGEIILENNKNIKVDLRNPLTHIFVDIRENNCAYIYDSVIYGAGGLPLGTAGEGLLFLSGGIDSPVAGYMLARRGLKFEALHFHSWPYTSERAKEKVIQLAKIMTNFHPEIVLHFVNIAKLQEEINKKCDSDYMIMIMRRFMYRIGEIISHKRNLKAIITGENLGQVASQTLESLTLSNNVIKDLIVFRPLLSFDKIDIIKIAEKINTYSTSILPYEDCCTVFLPKNPVIKPKLKKVLIEEEKLNINELLEESMSTLETLHIVQ